MGIFFFVAEQKSASFNAFLTVWGLTGLEMTELMNCVAWTALSSFLVVIWWIIDCLFTCYKLGRMTSRMILFVALQFFADAPHSALSQASFCLDLMLRIPLIEERSNRRAISSRNRSHNSGRVLRRWLIEVEHVKLVQTRSHDLVYTFHKVFPSSTAEKYWENIKTKWVKKLPQ